MCFGISKKVDFDENLHFSAVANESSEIVFMFNGLSFLMCGRLNIKNAIQVMSFFFLLSMIGRRPWPASSLLTKRWMDDGDRDALDACSHEPVQYE